MSFSVQQWWPSNSASRHKGLLCHVVLAVVKQHARAAKACPGLLRGALEDAVGLQFGNAAQISNGVASLAPTFSC